MEITEVKTDQASTVTPIDIRTDIVKWSEILVSHHKNPKRKFELTGTLKLYLPSEKEKNEQYTKVNSNLDIFKSSLSYQLADKRSNRSTAIWLEKQKLAKLAKTVGCLKNFGYSNGKEKFLYSEEALHLMDKNRLSLLQNEVHLSMQESFNICFGKLEFLMKKYLVHKTITIDSFRLKPYLSKVEKHKPKKMKRSPDRLSPFGLGKCKSKRHFSKDTNNKYNPKFFKNIFSKLQTGCPLYVEQMDSAEPDYEVFEIPNANNASLNLYLRNNDLLFNKVGYLNEESILNFTCLETVCFLNIGRVKLPSLI